MTTRTFASACRVKAAIASLFLTLLLCGQAFAQTKPNVVIILADDLGYGDVGFNGVQDIPTPNIDAIAASGILCTNGYVTEPYCAPSRAALLTGRYQQRYGFNSGPNTDSDNPQQALPLTESLLPQLLKPAGYVCGAFGKWHLGFADLDLYPLQRGFDEYVGFLFGKSDYYNANLLNGNTIYNEPNYLTDVFTADAVSFVNNHATQPFFLYLAYNAPHDPYDVPPQEYLDRVSYITDPDRKIYAAMIVALDDGVGKVVQALRDNGVLDNTLLIFLSDNGAPSKDNFDGTVNSNLPLRGYKLNMLEGGIRVPFAVQWPARLPAGVIDNDVVSSLDLFPTVAAAVGVTPPLDRVFDGLNILPYLSGEQASPVRTLFWQWFGLGPTGPLDALTTIWAVRNGPYKLVLERDTETAPPALYNLVTDIGETKDLAAKKPTEVATLQNLYGQWKQNAVNDIFEKDSDIRQLVIAGDWNAFNIEDTTAPWNLKDIFAPDPIGTPDSYNWWTATIHVATTGGDTTPGTHSFATVADHDYSTQWGGATIAIDSVTNMPSQSASGLGPLNTITLEDSFYYSMRVIDTNDQLRRGAGMQLAVMKTSAPPITVSRRSQEPAQPTATDPIVIRLATSRAKSPEERVYVRWSNDGFITSQLVAATGAGKSYTATIPPQPANIAVFYTIITSTSDLSSYTTSAIIDELTLALNGPFNARPPVLPTITQQPANVSVIVGQQARFSVTAAGMFPVYYQWEKNGSAIPGAILSSYKTPPTTTSDNGALYSVIVSAGAGSVVSNNAVLTVKSR